MRQRFILQTALFQLAATGIVLLSPDARAGPPLPPILFVSRNPVSPSVQGTVPGIGPRYRTALTGGRLLLRNARGSVTTLVGADRMMDVSDPCVSWDAKRVLFAGVERPDSSWRIYEIGLDGAGFRQVTRSDRLLDLSQFGGAAGLFHRYDDFDPCYLPDGRIVFASTRYPTLASLGRVLTSNLFIVNADGTGMRRITTERNGAEEPCVDPLTGRLVYARWWVNIDRPSNSTRGGLSREPSSALTDDIANLWQTVTVKPDGDELKLFAGFPRTRDGVQAYKPSIMADGRMLGTHTGDPSLAWGTGGSSVRLFRRGPGTPLSLLGRADGTPPYALEASELDTKTIVFSYSADGEDYGVYVSRPDGSRIRPLVDFEGTLELDPQPVRRRRVPPLLEDYFPHRPADLPPTEDPDTHAQDDFFRFDCMNVFANAGVDVPIPDAPRITRKARIRFFMNVQRQNPYSPDPSILLKDAEVMYHGGVHEHDLPAEVSLFEQLVDSAGKVLQTTDGKFAHVSGFNFERQGGGTKCIGCHAGHSMMDVPMNGSVAAWFNLAPSAQAVSSSYHTSSRGNAHTPDRVVDRQARTGGDSVVWVAGEGSGAWLRLEWPMPVEVREFILYGIPGGLLSSTVAVDDCEITLFAEGRRVRTIASTGNIGERWRRIPLAPIIIDAAQIVVKKSRGTIDGRKLTGLAEIEAIGRIPRPD